MSKLIAFAGGVALGAILFVSPDFASAAPVPPSEGACCNLLGCCAPTGQCRQTTLGGCNGIADQYQGNGTTCAALCPTTTTTLEPVGACCLSGGGCSTESEATCKELGSYQGDGTDCETSECPMPTTTTLPEIPTGACCAQVGGCDEVTEKMCDGTNGSWQGEGTQCQSAECPGPTTTTTVLVTTTTTYNPTTTLAPTTTTTEEPIVPLCGDANNDLDITAADALIALKTSVGSAQCPLTRCDYNGSGEVLTSDALAILKVAVGQVVIPQCPVEI